MAPTITEASSLSSTSVRIIWSITSNLNLISSFTVEIRLAPDGDWEATQRSANAVTLLAIQNRMPFTRYNVRVTASYINGGETVSDITDVVTLEDIPSSPPREVITRSNSDTDLEIFWQVLQTTLN